MTWGILVPQPGIEPLPPAVEARSLNHQTTEKSSFVWTPDVWRGPQSPQGSGSLVIKYRRMAPEKASPSGDQSGNGF